MGHQLLHRLEPGERIVVMGRQKRQFFGALVAFEDDRGREAAVDRQDRMVLVAFEDKGFFRLVEQQQLLAIMRAGFGIEQRGAQRNEQFRRRRHFALLGNPLGAAKRRGAGLRIVRQFRRYSGRPRRFVPFAELRQIDFAAVFHRGDKILAGRRLAIVAVEIEIGALAELLRSHQRCHHPDHFRALVVDGGGVEIGDFLIAFRTDRMGQRASILGELRGAQDPHILDPLERRRAHVGGEALVAVDGEAFLQTELEPVTASHSVSRPIVKIFVRDHALDTVEIGIGGDFGVGENIARVEDIEALVLHRAHVEITDRNDIEQAEIIFTAIGLLVPAHRILERLHRVTGAIEVAVAHPYIELDRFAGPGGEAVAVGDQIARDQREQIARLQPGVIPLHPVAAVFGIAFGDLVTVA